MSKKESVIELYGKCKPDIQPKNIVAFTFTEKAAEELKSRIYKYAKEELGGTIGFADMYVVTSLFLSTMSILNESWDENAKWDAKTLAVLEKYKSLFYEKHYFDYSLILREMLEQMQQNEEFYKIVTDRVRYLTVDKYQDTNPIQERLIKCIKDSGCNLCIVGDDDQTIYQFRGSEGKGTYGKV